jgi:hypothetical protein
LHIRASICNILNPSRLKPNRPLIQNLILISLVPFISMTRSTVSFFKTIFQSKPNMNVEPQGLCNHRPRGLISNNLNLHIILFHFILWQFIHCSPIKWFITVTFFCISYYIFLHFLFHFSAFPITFSAFPITLFCISYYIFCISYYIFLHFLFHFSAFPITFFCISYAKSWIFNGIWRSVNIEVRPGDCSVCRNWWNCWPSLFKFSLHTYVTFWYPRPCAP